MAGEYDDFEDLDDGMPHAAVPEGETRLQFRIDYDARATSLGLGDDITERAYALRCDPADGGPAESMEDVVDASSEAPNRGTLRAPRLSHVHDEITLPERERFLHNYATTGAWNQSAYDVGHNGAAFKRLAQSDPAFGLQVAEAVQDYRELLQMEIVRRGVRGVVEPVFGRGGKDCPDQVVGYVRKFSDRLLELEARAAWPRRYRENVVATDGRRFGVLVVPGTASPEDWNREALAALQKPVARRKVTRPVD